MGNLWLRHETKRHERRTPLLPENARALVQSGHDVVVETSETRIFPDHAYASAGCELVPPGTWVDADSNYFVLGLKELPEAEFALRHQHIYYAHCYKGQRHSRQVLERFLRGGGTLLDCEYLTDDRGKSKTVAKIGWLSGYVGAAMAVQFYLQKHLGRPLKVGVPYFSDVHQLITHTIDLAQQAQKAPSLVIIGGRGNAGSGAAEFCQEVNMRASLWGRAETSSPDVAATLNQFEVLVNCIQAEEPGPPFLTEGDLYADKKLSILADVTCDVGSPAHRFPFYSRITTFDEPSLAVGPDHAAVDVIAIDHLTTWLPLEASRLIAEPLFVELRELLDAQDNVLPAPWLKTKDKFLGETGHFR
ncbi:MAG: hypothetical protein WCJ41_20135 [Aestuariivirga sp.]|uniref:hypothetical protein n=1 Tax=Aestuariivirga sp. TaxID=2650926 RepID=UPI0030173EF0